MSYFSEVRELKAKLSRDKLLSSIRSPFGYLIFVTLLFFQPNFSSAQNPFFVQTGPYAKSSKSQPSQCWPQIKKAVSTLNRYFGAYTFRLDSGIRNCKSLEKGVAQLRLFRTKVRRNLKKMISPLHTIFLTNKTKFNHDTIGKMGLHIDVNKSGEIRKRLIRNQVHPKAIQHERSMKLKESMAPEEKSSVVSG